MSIFSYLFRLRETPLHFLLSLTILLLLGSGCDGLFRDLEGLHYIGADADEPDASDTADAEDIDSDVDTGCEGVICPSGQVCIQGECLRVCEEDADCRNPDLYCADKICTPIRCDDGVQNGDESDIDCGGGCERCGLGKSCFNDTDCASGICSGDGICVECLESIDCEGCQICQDTQCVDDNEQCEGCESCSGGQCIDDDEHCSHLDDNGYCAQAQCVECAKDSHCALDGVCSEQYECTQCDRDRSPFGGGSGTEASPYRICSPHHLDSIREDLGAHYKLYNDILMEGFINFKPIGEPPDDDITPPSDGVGFSGVLDGAGFGIFKLDIYGPQDDYQALFAYVEEGGSIERLNLVSFFIEGKSHVGSLVALNKGNLKNIGVENVDVRSHKFNVGGLVAVNEGKVENAYVSGFVQAEMRSVGGLVGVNDGYIRSSYAAATVTGNNWIAGGLVGQNNKAIYNSYATGDVKGAGAWVGGFVGSSSQLYEDEDSDNQPIIENCYAFGNAYIKESIHDWEDTPGMGLVGILHEEEEIDDVNNSFWNGTACNGCSCDDCHGFYGEELTEAQFKEESTFSAWDFSGTWKMSPSKGRPILSWQDD